MRAAIVLCVAILLASGSIRAQTVTPQDAARHVGQEATVCGTVASARYAPRSGGQPTFLNLDAPYPRQIFSVVIWGDDRQKFGQPETAFAGKRVCATGAIELFRGKPEIVLRDPDRLRLDVAP